MRKIWKVGKAATFKEVEKNLFIVTFSKKAEKQRIFSSKPWLFDNSIFSLQPLDGRKQLNKIRFDTKYFWVQLHDLPVHYMKQTYGELIGSSIGKVLDIDVDTDDTG